jgi:hypothetical protein
MRVRELRPDSSTNRENKLGRLGGSDARSAVGCLPASQPDVHQRPDFSLFPLLRALFFPLLAIVLAPAAFLSLSQGLAL